jgi:acetyltransferase-like isoleucine patch superfamily enzyme
MLARVRRHVQDLKHPMQRVTLRGRVLEPYRRRRFYSFGRRSVIHRPMWIFGAHQMALGSEVLILHSCWLSVEMWAWNSSPPVLRIGNRVGIRPFCAISASRSIRIDDDVILGAFTSVVDSDHTFSMGRPNVMHNPQESAPIRIGRGTWVAERVAILKGADIGRCCIIGANSVVRGTIPDYSVAVGAPARVVGTIEGVDADAPAPTASLWRDTGPVAADGV